jgi:hypothetical protein
MDLGEVRALVLGVNFEVHGLDVIVTRDGEDPIETRGVWLTTDTESLPSGSAFPRREPIRVMALRRDEVPTVPKGTVIVAPETHGGEDETWIVDAYDLQRADQHRVIVRRAVDAES